MTDLTLLANKYETDKGTTCYGCHGFTEFYENHVNQFKGKNPKILEIGVENGCSLKMWNEYFEGDCEIYGLDNNPKFKTKDNIHIIYADQSIKEDWDWIIQNIGNNFDIIIDDGSHVPEHQALSLYIGTKLLKPNGIYIIEDLHTNLYEPKDGYPLHSLIYGEKMCGLTDEENDELFNKINKFELFVNYNKKVGEMFGNKSITSVIKFKP